MDENLTVNACIGVREGCGVKWLVNPDGQIEFSLGSPRHPIELAFDLPALRHFVELAGVALEQAAVSLIQDKNEVAQAVEETAL